MAAESQAVYAAGNPVINLGYADFTAKITDRRALAEIVDTNKSVAAAHAAFLEKLESWWKKHLPEIEALAPSKKMNGNVYALRRSLLASIEQTFADNKLLTGHQVRGAFARYMDELKADLKSIAASGWGSELIPDADILQSQFPEILAEMETKRTRVAELMALFSAADEEGYGEDWEEDWEDENGTGILPKAQVKELKTRLREAKGNMKLAKRDPGLGNWKGFESKVKAIEAQLAKHKAFEDEARQLKSDLRATEKKQDDLVAAARVKIDREEAKRVIIDNLHRLLVQTYESYLRAGQRECQAALENLYNKYAVTAEDIEKRRDAASAKLKGFLGELGYE